MDLKKLVKPPSSETARSVEHWVTVGVAAWVVYQVIRRGPVEIGKSLADAALSYAREVPGLSEAIDKEEDKALDGLRVELLGDGDEKALTEIPEESWSSSKVLSEAEELAQKMRDAAPKGWGGIYYKEDADLQPLQARVWKLFSSTNALYPGIFPAVRKFEAELASMGTELLGGKERPGACSLLTSGGTESIFLAIKAYRDRAVKQYGMRVCDGLEVIAGDSAHPALDKACSYLCLTLVKIPVTAATDFRLDPEEVRKRITSRTICIYTSAPSFPHGVVDPIEEIAAVGRAHKVGVHVDNCLGGILLTFMKEQGNFGRGFDLRVDGVETVSCDLHKYGMASKGASIVAYSTPELRRWTYTTTSDWSGGLYTTSSSQGSRAGGIMAVAWATVLRHGKQGYRDMANTVHRMVTTLATEIPKMDGLRLLVNPDASVVAFTSDDYDIYAFIDHYKSSTGRSLVALQKPPAAQICVSQRMETDFQDLLQDLRNAAAHCYKNLKGKPAPKEGTAAIYGSAASLPASAIDRVLRKYPDVCLTVKKKE